MLTNKKNPQQRSESSKDWSNPAFQDVYLALAREDRIQDDNKMLDWLNANGFCNLTVCPECHTDDFVHVEGCSLDILLTKELGEKETN